jgi:hypothetical protein
MRHPPFAEEEVDQWYILEVREDLKELVTEITGFLFCTLVELTGDRMIPPDLEMEVEEALKESLGRYLCENVFCGETLLCGDAVQFDPWVGLRV